MIQKRLIKSGIKLLLCNPSLIKSLFTFDFHKIYCSYFIQKLKEAQKGYVVFKNKNFNNDLLEKIELINADVLKDYSRNGAFYIPLYFLVRELKPEIVIETGVHRGVSSLFILQAMEDNNKGTLYSIDLPFAEYETDTRGPTKSFLPLEKVGVCVNKELRKRWNLILEDSKKELPKLISSIKSLDIFLHDSKHTYEHMLWEFETIWPVLKENGILISDNINWCSAFDDFAIKVGKRNIKLKKDKTSDTEIFGIIVK